MHSIPSRPHHIAGNLNGETGEMEGVREAGERRPEEGGYLKGWEVGEK